MSLDALYPKPLLRLAAMANGAGRLPEPTATSTRVNPICGDKIVLDLQVKDEVILAIGYEVKACVICQAAASAMAVALTQKPAGAASTLRAMLQTMLKEDGQPPAGFDDFDAVRSYPSRHLCALLPLDAAIEALEGTDQR